MRLTEAHKCRSVFVWYNPSKSRADNLRARRNTKQWCVAENDWNV